MQDLSELQVKISTCTAAIKLQLDLISMGSQGRVEKEISDALPEIRESLNWIPANFRKVTKVLSLHRTMKMIKRFGESFGESWCWRGSLVLTSSSTRP